ncbi:GFA family protein [Niveispirillum fermenti]|uniref:GFA family protein n=1 Tax=Niveispirillum fermenti TaxID=1233113 RepID=UPI003A84A630
MTEFQSLAGQCYCGAVRYRVTDAFAYAANCHCSGCRRATGSAFKPFAGIEARHLSITQGQIRIYGDALCHDAHCPTCGSLLYSLVRDGAYVHVTLGTLVDTPTIRPTEHIFVGSKAPWYNITDNLPQFQEHRP